MHKVFKISLKIFLALIILLTTYFISYYLSYLKYNNKDNIELASLKIENNNLKEQVKSLENIYNIKPLNNNYLITRVILRNIHEFYNEIVLLSDSNQVKVGNAVINEEGLIGLVKDIKGDKVYVALLTSNYNISVKINDTYGNLNNKKVTMLDKYSDINIGDIVYTSGLTNIPENILVGYVKEVNKTSINTEVTISLLDNNNLNYVAIMVNK